MTDAKLKSYVERIERLEEERKAIGGDVRDIYTEAKGNHYNPKALRKIIAMRRQKADPVVDAEVEAYKAALGMAVEMVSNGDVSLRKAAKATGVSKSSIHRALAVPAVSHDPKTGEITDSRVTEDVDGEQAERGGAIVCRHSVDPLKANEPESEVSLAGEAEAPAPIDNGLAAEAERLGLTAVVRDLEAKHRPDTRTFDEIAGEMPAHLRRVPA